jgi:hypothetical protein
MSIIKIERFYCPICDYVTEYQPTIEQVKKTGICPACQNGHGTSWSKKVEKWSDKRKITHVPLSRKILD